MRALDYATADDTIVKPIKPPFTTRSWRVSDGYDYGYEFYTLSSHEKLEEDTEKDVRNQIKYHFSLLDAIFDAQDNNHIQFKHDFLINKKDYCLYESTLEGDEKRKYYMNGYKQHIKGIDNFIMNLYTLVPHKELDGLNASIIKTLPPIPQIDFPPDTLVHDIALYPRCVIAIDENVEKIFLKEGNDKSLRQVSAIPDDKPILYVFHATSENKVENTYFSHLVCKGKEAFYDYLKLYDPSKIPSIGSFVEVNDVPVIAAKDFYNHRSRSFVCMFDRYNIGILLIKNKSNEGITLSKKVKKENIETIINIKDIESCMMVRRNYDYPQERYWDNVWDSIEIVITPRKNFVFNETILQKIYAMFSRYSDEPSVITFVLNAQKHTIALSLDVLQNMYKGMFEYMRFEIIIHNGKNLCGTIKFGGHSLYAQNAGAQSLRIIMDTVCLKKDDKGVVPLPEYQAARHMLCIGNDKNIIEQKKTLAIAYCTMNDVHPDYTREHCIWIARENMVFSLPLLQCIDGTFLEHIGCKQIPNPLNGLNIATKEERNFKKSTTEIHYTFVVNQNSEDKRIAQKEVSVKDLDAYQKDPQYYWKQNPPAHDITRNVQLMAWEKKLFSYHSLIFNRYTLSIATFFAFGLMIYQLRKNAYIGVFMQRG